MVPTSHVCSRRTCEQKSRWYFYGPPSSSQCQSPPALNALAIYRLGATTMDESANTWRSFFALPCPGLSRRQASSIWDAKFNTSAFSRRGGTHTLKSLTLCRRHSKFIYRLPWRKKGECGTSERGTISIRRLEDEGVGVERMRLHTLLQQRASRERGSLVAFPRCNEREWRNFRSAMVDVPLRKPHWIQAISS